MNLEDLLEQRRAILGMAVYPHLVAAEHEDLRRRRWGEGKEEEVR